MTRLVIFMLLSVMAVTGIAIAPPIEAQRLQGFDKSQKKGLFWKKKSWAEKGEWKGKQFKRKWQEKTG